MNARPGWLLGQNASLSRQHMLPSCFHRSLRPDLVRQLQEQLVVSPLGGEQCAVESRQFRVIGGSRQNGEAFAGA